MSQLRVELKPYWDTQNKLTLSHDLLLFGWRIVVPFCLQKQTLEKLHHGHQSIQRCRLHAQSSVWWPGLSKQIKEIVQHCPTCALQTPLQHEPMIALSLPSRSWGQTYSISTRAPDC